MAVMVDKTTLQKEDTLVDMTPEQVAQYGLSRYNTNPALRLINAAHFATVQAAGKSHYRPKHVVIRLVGPAGVGKTAVVEDYCRQEDIGYVKLDTSVTDIAEVFGMVFVNQHTGQTTWAKPHWWPEEGTRGIVNLDDSL